jgi:glucokinase
MLYFVGIDIGGTNIKYGYFSLFGELLLSYKIPTPNKNILKTIIDFLDKNYDLDDCKGIAIGVPGPIVKNNLVTRPNNINCEIDLDNQWKQLFSKNTPYYFINDANLATFGEYFHLKRQEKSAVMITLGTGVGGGIIINDQLVEGANGKAGEIGHMIVPTNHSTICGCGGKNHIESLIGSRHLIARYEKYSKLSNQTIKDNILAYDNGSPDAKKVINYLVNKLVLLINNLDNVINPEIFIIGGGVTEGLDYRLINVLTKLLPPTIKVTLATLGNNAGIWGGYYFLKNIKANEL